MSGFCQDFAKSQSNRSFCRTYCLPLKRPLILSNIVSAIEVITYFVKHSQLSMNHMKRLLSLFCQIIYSLPLRAMKQPAYFVENMLERTLVAQRTVFDAVSSKLFGDIKAVQNIPITKGMIRHCTAARSRYRNFLDEQQDANVSNTNGLQTHSVEASVSIDQLKDNLIKKKTKLVVSVTLILKLTKEADDLAVKAERKNQLKFLSESNAKRKRIDDLKTDSDALKSKVQKLEDLLNKAKTK